jgi:hypothetical protein
VTGGITFSTRAGDFTATVQPGGIVSMEDIASHSFRNFRLHLLIVGGTRRYANMHGRLSLSYESVWTRVGERRVRRRDRGHGNADRHDSLVRPLSRAQAAAITAGRAGCRARSSSSTTSPARIGLLKR